MEYTEISLAKSFVALKGEFDHSVHTRTEWKALLKGNGYAEGIVFNRYPSVDILERYHLLEVCGTEEYVYVRHDKDLDADVEATGTRELLKLADKLDVRRNRVASAIAKKIGAVESPEHACEWSVEASPAHREYEASMAGLEREINERKQRYMRRYIEESRKERALVDTLKDFVQYIGYEG